MRRFIFCSLFALAVCCPPERAHAQYYQPPRVNPVYRPPVSPYLNLLRRGSDPAVNYYGIVRPEIEFRSGIQSLQQQVSTVGQEVTAQDQQALNALPETGHAVQFFNYSHYYGQGFNQGTAGARGVTRATTTAPTPGSRAPALSSGGVRPPTR